MRKTVTIFITLAVLSLLLVISAQAASNKPASDKPETHDAGWLKRHGKVSGIDDSECMGCHVDRLDCIRCHEDSKPRDHTSGSFAAHFAAKLRPFPIAPFGGVIRFGFHSGGVGALCGAKALALLRKAWQSPPVTPPFVFVLL
jgi:hypothetical protein